MKTCNKCGELNLEWDHKFFELNKTWRLMNPNTDIPHDCKSPKNIQKGWKKGKCRNCNIEIAYNPKKYNPSGLCEDCKEHHEND